MRRRRDPSRLPSVPRGPTSAAPRDHLTRLAPRDALERAVRLLAGARRAGIAPPVRATCLLVDVAGMKATNAAGGFSAGDDLLRAAATSLRAIAPDARLLARLGGDELVALFTGPAAPDSAAAACRRAADSAAPRLRAGWVEIEPGESPRALFDRLYARCRAGDPPAAG